MPYDDERAVYEPLRRIAENERVRGLLSSYRVRQQVKRGAATLTTIDANNIPKTGWQPSWVLAVDGSFLPVRVRNGFPGAEAAYITVASVLIDVAKIRDLDQHRPVEPKVFRSTQEAESIDDILPGCNVMREGDSSAKLAFRRALYELLQSKSMSLEGETLLDTYEFLLQYKPVPKRTQEHQRCPFEDCPDDTVYVPSHGIYACPCSEKRTLYSTDALRIHERMNPLGGSNEKVFGEVMQVVERLWIVHILRTLEKQKWLTSLRRLAILVDGPLAVFGQPAWISQAIAQELRRMNTLVKNATGHDVLLLGIEKGGAFAEHFAQIDQDENGAEGQFPLGAVALLTDSYVKQCIYPSDSAKLYGEGTYFGRKFLYKTRSGARIVATLPYLYDDDKDWERAELSQFPRLGDATLLLDELVSSRYPNALQPIIAAHAEASIPLNLGTKVLERLARDLTVDN